MWQIFFKKLSFFYCSIMNKAYFFVLMSIQKSHLDLHYYVTMDQQYTITYKWINNALLHINGSTMHYYI